MDSGVDFQHRMSSFRCLFNLDPPRTRDRIKSIQVKLKIELDTENDSIVEIIEKLNLYTWVEFKLGNYKNSRKLNEDVFDLTDGINITALINKAQILLREGDERHAEECVKEAENLSQSPQGEEMMIQLEAELAYSLSRLGGDDNLNSAIDMYTMVVKKKPEMYEWKFGLGILHRRATHSNVTIKMHSNMSELKHIELAFELLKDVADQSQSKGLKSRAHSQLAFILFQRSSYSADSKLFDGETVENRVHKALKYGSQDARILSDCGRIFRFSDLTKAIGLLEKSLKKREHSSTYHDLGKCYQQQAKLNAKNKKETHKSIQRKHKNTSENCKHIQEIENQEDYTRHHYAPTIANSPINEFPLNKYDPLVVKAKEFYQNAIKISHGCNIPTIYSLGRLLRACKETDEAIKQFTLIILQTSKKVCVKSKGEELQEHHEYLSTVTCAYEQAGYCLLDLARVPGKTREDIDKFNTKAEQKFLKAISLTATLCNLHPEIKRYEMLVWNAFKTLESQYEEMKESPEIIKKYIELLKRACKYEKIPEVIEKLRHLSEMELADPSVIKTALESYFALKKYESAFAFLTFPMITQNCNGQLQALALKVNLYTAASRLQGFDSSAKFLLKHLFNSCFEKERTNSYVADQFQVIDRAKDTQVNDCADVLIVDEVNEETSNVDVSVKVKKLQEIISGDFGLDVIKIDKRLIPGELKLNQQMRKIRRAKTVLILLIGEPQSSLFKSLLEFIPTMKMECSKGGKPGPHIVLGLKDDRVEVPETLMTYAKINLWSLLDRIQDFSKDDNNEDSINDPQCGAMDGHDAEVDALRSPTSKPDDDVNGVQGPRNSTDDFNDCTIAMMSLYCAMIGKEWPV